FFVQPHEPISYGLTSSNQGQDGCMFYNPLLTSLTDPNVANDQELMDWLTVNHNINDRRNTLGVFDAVLAGEMFGMRGGMAAFAVGAQQRYRTANSNGSELSKGTPNAIVAFDSNGVPNE